MSETEPKQLSVVKTFAAASHAAGKASKVLLVSRLLIVRNFEAPKEKKQDQEESWEGGVM